MLCVFFAQDCFLFWDLPVDAEGLVQDGDAAIGFGMIELVALILEDCCLAEYGKAVGKALGYEELPVIVLSQFDCDVLPVGR